jgi:ABC-type nitrate/sulfonate/bicarbonate transport system substrate-binding protein
MSPRQLYPTVLIVAVALLASLILHEISVAADRARIGYTSPGPQHGILWVGDVSGIFKKNNLDLEIIYMPETSPLRHSCRGRFNSGK